MKKGNLCKKPIVIGEISKHQWGIVVSGGGAASTEVSVQYKFPQLVVRKWKKDVFR